MTMVKALTILPPITIYKNTQKVYSKYKSTPHHYYARRPWIHATIILDENCSCSADASADSNTKHVSIYFTDWLLADATLQGLVNSLKVFLSFINYILDNLLQSASMHSVRNLSNNYANPCSLWGFCFKKRTHIWMHVGPYCIPVKHQDNPVLSIGR